MNESVEDILDRLEIDEEMGREIAANYLRCFPRSGEPTGARAGTYPGVPFRPGDRKKLVDLFFPLEKIKEPPGA